MSYGAAKRATGTPAGEARPNEPGKDGQAQAQEQAAAGAVGAGSEAASAALQHRLAEDHRNEERRKAAAAQQKEMESQEEPETVEMPVELEVHDAPSLHAEVTRVSELLSSVASHPWTVRVHSLKRISTLCKSDAFASVRGQPSFVSELDRLRPCLAEQLTDRRSQVVKQACATISALSSYLKSAYLADPADSPRNEVAESIARARRTWMSMTLFFIDALLPLIPITVQVIHASACLCLSAIVKNVAGVYQEKIGDEEGTHAYALISHLCTSGATHKHGIVRDHCYRAIANCMIRIHPRSLAEETELDREECARITSAAPGVEADAAAAVAASAVAAATPAAQASTSPPPSSPLFSTLESVILAGISDSFDKARAAARLCLIHLRTLNRPRADRVMAAMTPAQQKVFEKQLADFLTNRSLGAIRPPAAGRGQEAASAAATASSNGVGNTILSRLASIQLADEPEHNQSDDELEAELNPPKKTHTRGKSASALPAAATTTASGTGVLKGLRKKASLKSKQQQQQGGAEDIPVEVLTKEPKAPTAAASGETEGKEEDASSTKKDANASSASSSAASTPEKAKAAASGDAPAATPSTTAVAVVDPAEQQRARNFSLLSKLLDLENPMLTEKMIDFLLHEGVIDVLLSFIARVDPSVINADRLGAVKKFADLGVQYHNELDEEEAKHAAAASDASEGGGKAAPMAEWSDVPLTHRRRPASDDTAEQTATRRSFHVMQILCGQRQSQSLMAVLTPKIPAIVLQLLCVFHPASKGNFYHACAVLQKLVSVFPGTVLVTLCSPAGRTLHGLMLDHLHEPPVIPCVLSLLQASVDTRLMGSSVPSDFILHLRNADLLHSKLIARMVAHPCPSRIAAQGACDFLVQLVEKVQTQSTLKTGESMARIFEDVAGEGKAISQLVAALTDPSNERPGWQLSNLALLLSTFLAAVSDPTVSVPDTDVNAQALAQMMGNAVSLVKQVPNPLIGLKPRITHCMSEQIERICKVLTQDDETEAAEAHAAAAPNGAAPAAAPAASSPTSASSVALHPPVTFSAYTVPFSFTSRRLHLFRILLRLLNNDMDVSMAEADIVDGVVETAQILAAPRLFNRVPTATWSTLIHWFFRYTHNTIFLNHFKSLIISLLKFTVRAGRARDAQVRSAGAASHDEPADSSSAPPSQWACDDVWRVLLHELRFVSRMYAFYVQHTPKADSSDTGSSQCTPACAGSSTRSFILELGNHFRLSAELVSHHSLLWTELQSSQQWHSFLAMLRDESKLQARNLHVKPYEEDPHAAERAALERALGFSIGGDGGPPQNPNAFKIPPGFGDGIDLGSVFAFHLGYTDKSSGGSAAGTKKKKKKKKKKKSSSGSATKGRKSSAAGAGDRSGSEEEDEQEQSEDLSDVSASGSSVPSPSSSPPRPTVAVAALTPVPADAAPAASAAVSLALAIEVAASAVPERSTTPLSASLSSSPSPPTSPKLNASSHGT